MRAIARARVALALVLLASFVGVSLAAGDDATLPLGSDARASAAARVPEARREGLLTVFNRPIVTFRATFLGVPPAERAETARRRIAAVLDRGGAGQVAVEAIPQGAVLKIDGALAFVLANEDVDRLGSDALDVIAGDAKRALEHAIAETREAHSGRLMLAAAAWAGGATVVYLALLVVWRRVARAVTARMLRFAGSKAGKIRIHGAEIVHRERLRNIVLRLLQTGFWGFVAILTYEWIGYVLGRFPYTRPWGEQLNAFLIETIADMLTPVATATPGLFIAIAIFFVARAVTGLILMYTRTFRPGEYVCIAEHEGTIVDMGMFTTRLRTGLGEELTLPNTLVLGTVTKNYSRTVKGSGFVLDTAVTIGYDTPWRQVHAMLIEAARRTAGVVADPTPRVFQTALADFYVEYRLVCQATQEEPRPRAEVLSSLHANVQDVFNEHGVQIMSPHYLGDPGAPKVVPKDRWYAAPAAPQGKPPA